MSEWKPIESAPTYEDILLYVRNEGIIRGERRIGKFVDAHGNHVQPESWMPLPYPPAP